MESFSPRISLWYYCWDHCCKYCTNNMITISSQDSVQGKNICKNPNLMIKQIKHPFVLIRRQAYWSYIKNVGFDPSQVLAVRGNAYQRGNRCGNTRALSVQWMAVCSILFLPLSLFAFFASSISGVLFLLQCRIFSVIPVIPVTWGWWPGKTMPLPVFVW